MEKNYDDNYLEYRMKKEFRNSCWIAIFGCIFVWIVMYATNQFFPLLFPQSPFTLAIPCLIFCLLNYLPMLWRLRVNSDGISKKWLWGWEEWKFSDIQTGLIQKKSLSSNLLKHFGETNSQELGLDCLDSKDMQEVYKKINAHYRLPDAPEVLSSITLDCLNQTKGIFDSECIFITKDGKQESFSWDEVKSVFIIRLEPLRRDFNQLIVVLPGIELEFMSFGKPEEFLLRANGSTIEEINQFIFHYVDLKKISDLVLGQEIEYLHLVQRELKRIRKLQRVNRFLVIAILFMFMCLSIFVLMNNGPMDTLLCVLILASLIAPIIATNFYSTIHRTRELESALSKLEN